MNTKAMKTLVLVVSSVVLHGFSVKSKTWKDPGEAGMCIPVERVFWHRVLLWDECLYSQGCFLAVLFPKKGTSTIGRAQYLLWLILNGLLFVKLSVRNLVAGSVQVHVWQSRAWGSSTSSTHWLPLPLVWSWAASLEVVGGQLRPGHGSTEHFRTLISHLEVATLSVHLIKNHCLWLRL